MLEQCENRKQVDSASRARKRAREIPEEYESRREIDSAYHARKRACETEQEKQKHRQTKAKCQNHK